MGWVAKCQSGLRRTAALYDTCLALAQELRRADGIAWAMSSLGTIAQYEGKYERASAYYRESETVWRRLGCKAVLAGLLQDLGYVALRQGATSHAAAQFTESLSVAQEIGRSRSITTSLLGLAAVASTLSEYVQVVRLLGAVAASADTPCNQRNTQPVCHLQSGIAPYGAVRTHQQHQVLAEQVAGAQPFALALQKQVWGAGAGATACEVQMLPLPSALFSACCC